MGNGKNRRQQNPKGRGKKTYIKFDTGTPRGDRYGSSDRRQNKVNVRDYR